MKIIKQVHKVDCILFVNNMNIKSKQFVKDKFLQIIQTQNYL